MQTSLSTLLRKQPALLWRFLGIFQPPLIQWLHAILVCLVGVLFASSLWCKTAALQADTASGGAGIMWLHMGLGGLTLLLTCVLLGASLATRGFRYFFPYLFHDTAQLRKDIQASLRFKMVPPKPQGLAAVVQGLGFGALLLTVLSGACWFIAWRLSGTLDNTFLSLHKGAATLLGLYALGHGGMALAHCVLWQSKVIWKPKATPPSQDS